MSSVRVDMSEDAPVKSEHGEEALERYGLGGYCPISPGMVLNDRYQVLRKLGWGQYSTVWLAKDSLGKQQYVSVKICSAEATASPDTHELEYLIKARDQDPRHHGHNHIVPLRDHFRSESVNGEHLCVVSDVLGESVDSLARRYSRRRMPIHNAKSVVLQTLLALDYLHNSCGIIHTDIKPDNILMKLTDVDKKVEEYLSTTELETYPAVRLVDHPSLTQVVPVKSQPIKLSQSEFESLKDFDVCLADFGVSCWADKVNDHFTDMIQSPSYRAPEVLLGAGWDSRCDIWSVGCLAFELLAGRPFIAPVVPPSHIGLLAIRFGDFPPEELRKRGKYTHHAFKEDGSYIVDIPERHDLDYYVGYLELERTEHELISSFLTQAFEYMPERRPSAKQLSEHAWLKV